MTKSARSKGLNFTREVRRILEGMGHIVEGPGYGLAYYGGKMNPIHRDFFGVFDLMSFDGQTYFGHQVSTEANKATKIREVKESNLPGWVWCRFSNEEKGTGYEVWRIFGDIVEESEMTYGIRRGRKCQNAKNVKD